MSGGSAYLRVDGRKLQGGSQKGQDLLAGLYYLAGVTQGVVKESSKGLLFVGGVKCPYQEDQSGSGHLHYGYNFLFLIQIFLSVLFVGIRGKLFLAPFELFMTGNGTEIRLG